MDAPDGASVPIIIVLDPCVPGQDSIANGWDPEARFCGALAGLADGPRTGRPATYGREIRERVLTTTLTPPEGATHWSTRRLAVAVGVSPNTILRIWREGKLKPHRTETFKYSSDPDLVAKVTDVVGLYLNPPERAIVLSVDEKTQIQALDRTQPMLPMKPGQVERHTHDYKRHGTLVLSAALEIATGTVTTQTTARHRAVEFLDFLNLIARTYPRRELHVVLDKVSTHKSPEVERWLGRHKRVHFHFTPTSASWLNQVETWFGILTSQALGRGSFESVRASLPRSNASPARGTAAPRRSGGSRPPTRSWPRPCASPKRLQVRDTSRVVPERHGSSIRV